MDKENKKPKVSKAAKLSGRASGTGTPTSDTAPTGVRKRVMAENGKVLIVDSVGNVYLEQEDEDGVTQEFLLDVDEIPYPTIKDTALFRLPAWAYHKAFDRFRKAPATLETSEDERVKDIGLEPEEERDSGSSFEILETSGVEQIPNGTVKKRNKKGKK